MSIRFSRFYATFLFCLIGASVSVRAQAQDLFPGGSKINASAATSPTVSFGNLPALQVSTPIPGSAHVPGDFNGDGTSDLLWFNPTLSQVGYWTMSATAWNEDYPANNTVQRTSSKTFNVTPGYFVGAVGDFNNDGYADMVFTSANHDLWLWTNNQQGGFSSAKIGSYPSQWQLIGAGDVDGDGYDDLLWLDTTDCEFAYWTMHGAVRSGYKIIKIACGYYPIAIGYYAPTNRLSILWTSPANDLFIWDSTPSGFVSYNLTSNIGSVAHIWAIGGGYMGNGIGIESMATSSDGTYDIAVGGIYSRTFNASGQQTGFSGGMNWDGGSEGNYASGGYLIQGGNVNATALYLVDQASATVSTGGLAPVSNLFAGNAPIPPASMSWAYPVGWWIVGAPANGIVEPPSQ